MAAIGVAAGRSAAIAGKPAPTKAAPTKKGRDCSRPFQALGWGGVAAGSAIACRSGLGRDWRQCRAMRCHRGQARSHKGRAPQRPRPQKKGGIAPALFKPWAGAGVAAGSAIACGSGLGRDWRQRRAMRCHRGQARSHKARTHKGSSHKARSHKARSHKGSAHKKGRDCSRPFQALGRGRRCRRLRCPAQAITASSGAAGWRRS